MTGTDGAIADTRNSAGNAGGESISSALPIGGTWGWERMDIATACSSFLSRVMEFNPGVQRDLLERAFRYSWAAHEGQQRKSGEPYLAHPVSVALILAEQRLDTVTIAAGLLHDVLEDTGVTREQLAQEFGEQIARLVDGVTKIPVLPVSTNRERQAETYRKMLLAMAEDLRVVMVKFADRLHNLRTLRYLEPEKIEAIARETLDIYAPLAHRLGMGRLRWDLEDLAFKYLHPKEYKDIVARVVARAPEREALIESFAAPLRERLRQEGIEATIVGRWKHFYSIYRKMVEQNRSFDEIYDLLAIRVIVNTVRECYITLGIVHSLWSMIPDRFRDFISTPKANGYRSLHTTVVGEKAGMAEIQIRTWEMHHVAEDGIAAHWLYKDGRTAPTKDDQELMWLRNLIEWQKDLTDSTEFFESLRLDLGEAEVFVMTPKGDLRELPKGATVLDFAFAIHTDLGLHCIGAKVNGRYVPPNFQLKSGSTVEVLHLSTKKPSADWLQYVRTPRARSAIRRWLRNASRQESIELGRRILEATHKRLRVREPLADLVPALLQQFGCLNLDTLYLQVGRGEIPAGRVSAFMRERGQRASAPSRMVSHLVDALTGQSSGVLVSGGDNLMVRFGQCCNPIPGDPIVGFVTKGRGIVVHRADCEYAPLFAHDPERSVEVSWDTHATNTYIAYVEIHAADRTGLLHDIAEVFVNFGVNILEGRIETSETHARTIFKVQIQNRNQLRQIIERLQHVRGVERIERSRDASILPGAGRS